MDKPNKYFENKELCSKCGGKCCKRLPGTAFPIDFDMKAGSEKLINAITNGNYAIDCWEGDPGDNIDKRAYFVRPATKNAIGKVYDYSCGGECIFLTNSGCTIEAKNRPLGCKSLMPGKIECKLQYDADKRQASLSWRPYFDILDSFRDKEIKT